MTAVDLITEAREYIQWLNADFPRTRSLLARLADALERSLLAEVSTLEELAALPDGVIVQDSFPRSGWVYEKDAERGWDESVWWHTGADVPYATSELVLPVRILFTPPQNGEDNG